jgi:hypothetical protein
LYGLKKKGKYINTLTCSLSKTNGVCTRKFLKQYLDSEVCNCFEVTFFVFVTLFRGNNFLYSLL